MFDFAACVAEAAFAGKQVGERLVYDLYGSMATQTVSFGLDSVVYRIDLNDEHADGLRDSLGPFIRVARRERRLAGAMPSRTDADASPRIGAARLPGDAAS